MAKVKVKSAKVKKSKSIIKPEKESKQIKTNKVEKNTKAVFDPSQLINDDLDAIAKRMHLNEGAVDQGEPMSTGLLCLDVCLGGGIRPAWYTHFGPEQSAKTTGALVIMGAAINAKVPVIGLKDYEGSTSNSMPYVQSILKTVGIKKSVKEVFGERDPKTGKWFISPIVRYSEETIGEKFFDWLHDLLARLPDKKRIGGKWWYIYDDTKANKAKLGDNVDTSMSKKYGSGLYIPAEDGKLQAFIIVDSYPAMNPGANDEDESNNSLALQARMFSKHLPRVKGRLAPKRVAVLGINQLRAVPMAMYGPKEQEPGGQALRFNSDARLRWYPRSSGFPLWGKLDNGVEKERSVTVDGGSDVYRYVCVKAVKNKMSTPQREIWIRLWTEDGEGEARGIDPFFDTIQYLRITGQAKGTGRSKIILNLHGLPESKKAIPWETLKSWVLGDKSTMRAVSEKYGFKPMSLRSFCFKQIKDGTAEELYNNLKKSSIKHNDDEDEAELED